MKKFAFLLVLLTGCLDFASLQKAYADRDVREKVGVLANLDIAWPKSAEPFKRALAHFRAEGVTRVIVLGDPTKNGYPAQRKVFEDAYQASFRGTTAPELVVSEGPVPIGGVQFVNDARYPLTDTLCVYPLKGRRIQAGSMHGFEVSKVFAEQDKRTKDRILNSAQGLLVFVRDDGLTVHRLDFSTKSAAEVGAPWTVDHAGVIANPEQQVPRFWDDTTINVTRGYDGKGNVVYTVRWPPVLACHTGARAFSYNVQVGDKILRRVQSPAFFLPEENDGAAIVTSIVESELKGAAPRFGITPVSALGQLGPTVWSR